ncbi:antibiotic biosynthesis monooxygenase [Sphingomonas sp. MG17]|uniref:Antibiotic biosynthesis monooxygenase n=1 Tax=Sphingomonas tagetis TaxID=2949092 RepID=A0A9X2HLD8_9SPHN|nr:antibiotic biosynthesis monooxygenase family protein [Sphingomonas tagetis]MCP3731369.1 antibiotic biosynthesis monooxygenase [Sphingomonas tagetis]
MITEIVEFRIKPGTQDQFVAGVAASRPIFKRSPGFIGLELHHTVEDPAVFVLLIEWESVAHHMEMFQKSPEYVEWRANVGEFFADKPRLQHTDTKLSY